MWRQLARRCGQDARGPQSHSSSSSETARHSPAHPSLYQAFGRVPPSRRILSHLRNRHHVRTRTPRSTKMHTPFCSGRCQPRLRRGPAPVFVLSAPQRGSVGHRPQRVLGYFRSGLSRQTAEYVLTAASRRRSRHPPRFLRRYEDRSAVASPLRLGRAQTPPTQPPRQSAHATPAPPL